MAYSAAAIYIILLVPALILPHGEVARMIDTPMKFFELLWRNKRFCHYYHHQYLKTFHTVFCARTDPIFQHEILSLC